MPETNKELKEKYERLFEKYPDVVDLPTLCEMLDVSDKYIRPRLQKGIIRSFFKMENHSYMIPKVWAVEFALSQAYQDRILKKAENIKQSAIIRRGDYIMSVKIIAVANQKGGTGKTTTASNMGFALAAQGYRVLLADLDPQANLSMSFGIERPDELPVSMHNILSIIMDGAEMPAKSEYILRGEKLDIIPCNINLSLTEINLRDEMGGEKTLSDLLEPLRGDYDYIIIDTNPYLGLLTINALAACDSVLIPVSPQLWSATGLTDLLQTVFKVKRKINPRIAVEGILLTMCDERTRLYRDAKALLDDFCKDRIKIFDAHIPSTVKVGEANYSSRSVMDYDAKSKAALAYSALAREVSGFENGSGA